jgi:hypothetical protein
MTVLLWPLARLSRFARDGEKRSGRDLDQTKMLSMYANAENFE